MPQARSSTPLTLLLDRCPPSPWLRVDECALPAAAQGAAAGVLPLVAGVVAVRPAGSPALRAGALALAVRARQGVLARAAAAWVWTGVPGLVPRVVDLAVPPPPAPPPSRLPRPATSRLAVRTVRWSMADRWTLLGDVPVTDPVSTALDCHRLLPPTQARACVQALVEAGLVEAGLVEAGLVEAGLVEAGLVEAGLVEAGLVEAGSVGPLRPP